MLDYYIRNRKRLAKMESNPLGPYLKEAAARYRAGGHNYGYARQMLGIATRFGKWLRTRRVPLDRLANQHVTNFLHWYSQPSKKFTSRRSNALSAVNFVLALIPRRILSRFQPPNSRRIQIRPQTPAQVEVARCIEHLRRNRGLAESTLKAYQRYLTRFMAFYFKRRQVDHSAFTTTRIHAYVDSLLTGRRNYCRCLTCCALRGYFRFLQLQGVSTRHLLAMVPTVRQPRAALSPKWLTAENAEQLLQSLNRSQAIDKRNYAAILCMMDLGLRVGDVARLSLDDIDWRAGTIQVANQKRGRPYRLPLPKRLGKALADYLTKGRSASSSRAIFLNHGRPRGTPVRAATIGRMMARAWKRAGLDQQFFGTHVLRHSVATRMKRQGVGLKLIADVLGHQSIQTTTLYAQVDLPALRTVAQSWPEVRP